MLFTILSICILGNAVIANAQTCYYPDSSIASLHTPCHALSAGDGASACCHYADICLSNGLCLSQLGTEVVHRGSCTDPSWQSPECSQYCYDGKCLSERSRNLFNKRLQYGLILRLILLLQSNGAVGRLYISSIISRINGCSAVARVIQTTTHAWMPPKQAPHRFRLKREQVIFDRTSGSTSSNNTIAAPVTTSASASSSKTGTAIGAGISALLGVLLLVTLRLLWREKKIKQSFRKDAQTWEGKSGQLVQAQKTLVDVGGAEHQPPPQQLDG